MLGAAAVEGGAAVQIAVRSCESNGLGSLVSPISRGEIAEASLNIVVL